MYVSGPLNPKCVSKVWILESVKAKGFISNPTKVISPVENKQSCFEVKNLEQKQTSYTTPKNKISMCHYSIAGFLFSYNMCS